MYYIHDKHQKSIILMRFSLQDKMYVFLLPSEICNGCSKMEAAFLRWAGFGCKDKTMSNIKYALGRLMASLYWS